MFPAPTESPLVTNVATPEEFTVRVPSRVEPLKKLTVPSVEPVGAGLTVTVKVTGCPTTTGFGEAASVVEVTVNGATVSVNPTEVEVANSALPE